MKHRKSHPPLVQRPLNAFFFAMIPVMDKLENIVQKVHAQQAAQREANKKPALDLIGG